MRIQINDQGKEFVNEVPENLHEITGTQQRITSAYHPNGLCELSKSYYQRFLGKSSGGKAERIAQYH